MCGWIAFKLHKSHPNLGCKTSQPQSDDEITSPWILHLSRGGLLMPGSSFLEASKEFESLFVEFHGDNIGKNDMVIE